MTETIDTAQGHPPGMLGIPHVDWMWTESVQSLVLMIASGGLPSGSQLQWAGGSSPARNRNKIAQEFLARRHLAWVAFLDSDMTPAPNALQRLLAHNVDCVGAMCWQRMPPYLACAAPMSEPAPGETPGLHEAHWVGTGLLVVRRRVLERMPAPWFEHTEPGGGEDLEFCRKVRELGFAVHVDFGCHVGHMSARPVGRAEASAFHESPEGQAKLDALQQALPAHIDGVRIRR